MPQNILLIQDDPADAQAVRDALLSSSDGPFQVDWVRNCAEGLNRLALTGKQMGRPSHMGRHSHGVAAVLVDLYLPDSRGIETFDRLFQAAPQIPILVLIGASDEAIARLAVQRGAQDFLLKDRLDNYWLPKALRSMVERAANGEALYQEKERAEVTLNSIGDAVMSTDEWGNVTYLNSVAEQLTGWSRAEATGRAVEEVFHIVDWSWPSRWKPPNRLNCCARRIVPRLRAIISVTRSCRGASRKCWRAARAARGCSRLTRSPAVGADRHRCADR